MNARSLQLVCERKLHGALLVTVFCMVVRWKERFRIEDVQKDNSKDLLSVSESVLHSSVMLGLLNGFMLESVWKLFSWLYMEEAD